MEALKDTNQEDTTIADRCLDGAGQAQNNLETIYSILIKHGAHVEDTDTSSEFALGITHNETLASLTLYDNNTTGKLCLPNGETLFFDVATVHLNERVRDILNDAQGF